MIYANGETPETSKLFKSLFARRHEMHLKLLSRYKSQIDPYSVYVGWKSVKIINYPIPMEKIYHNFWTAENLENLEEGLDTIEFVKLSDEKLKSRKLQAEDDADESSRKRQKIANDEFRSVSERRLAVHASLLNLFRQQISQTATKIPWERVNVLNFPIFWGRRYFLFWTAQDMDLIENSLSQIIFQEKEPFQAGKTSLVKEQIRSLRKTLLEIYRKDMNKPEAKSIC